MPHPRHDLGTITRDHPRDGAVVHLERSFDASPTELWQLLTDPAELAEWLCAAVELDPRPGGAITLRFGNSHTTIRGRVVRFDAPAVLEYTWRREDEPESVVRFELHATPANAGTRLSVTHTRCNPGEIGEMAAGWHHHLELLATQLAGHPVAWDWARFTELHTQYTAPVA
jgi:uncharacterized protein YndB with AHSA1/START domain